MNKVCLLMMWVTVLAKQGLVNEALPACDVGYFLSKVW